MSAVKPAAACSPLTCLVDERGAAKISLVEALYESPDVKVVTIHTADRAPLAQQIWSSEYGGLVLVAANEAELTGGSLEKLTRISFYGLSTDWQTYITSGKHEVRVFFVRLFYGMETRQMWTSEARA